MCLCFVYSLCCVCCVFDVCVFVCVCCVVDSLLFLFGLPFFGVSMCLSVFFVVGVRLLHVCRLLVCFVFVVFFSILNCFSLVCLLLCL